MAEYYTILNDVIGFSIEYFIRIFAAFSLDWLVIVVGFAVMSAILRLFVQNFVGQRAVNDAVKTGEKLRNKVKDRPNRLKPRKG